MRVIVDEGGYVPSRAYEFDAGLDLYSPRKVKISGMGDWVTIDTKVHVEIPKGYVGMIKSRSSLMGRGIKTEGVIDSGYTGTIKVVLFNFGGLYQVNEGDKIAQLVILPVSLDTIELVEEFKATERGDGGFGSTGR